MQQSLSLNLKQKILMTPKLRQSISILRLSAYELSELIEKEYLENPLLEVEAPEADPVLYSSRDKTAELLSRLAKDDEKPEAEPADDGFRPLECAAPRQTLEDYLSEQLLLQLKNPYQIKLAHYIIGLLDQNGYLHTPPAEIASLCQADIKDVETVLHALQQLEPAGIAAQSLAECLAIQARRSGIYSGLVKAVIDRHLDLVAEGRVREIARSEHCEPALVQTAIDTIRRFNPRPGASFSWEEPLYILPDVTVRDIGGHLEILLNDKCMPRLRLSSFYRQYGTLDADSQKYIEHHVNSALWLIKSIEQRRTTLRRVVGEIVRRQEEAFRRGLSYIKPLLMKTVADSIGVHESTVSRTAANKYIDTPYGIVPLKKFFSSSAVKKAGSTEMIAAAQVKEAMRELIDSENKRKPLSDQHIADMLKEKNMAVSRRTVMKYREQLGYPSSAKRRRY